MKNWNAFFGTLVILIGLSVGCGYPVGKYTNPMNGRVAKVESPETPKMEEQAPIEGENLGAETKAQITETSSELETMAQIPAVASLVQVVGSSESDVVKAHVDAFQAPTWVKKTMRRKIERIQRKVNNQGVDAQLRLIIILAVIAIILALVAGLLDALTGFWGLWWIIYIAASILMVIALILGLIYLVNEVL